MNKSDKEKPLFSIIVPAYNSQDTITETITSILNQIENNFEVIIINDGSTDNTVEVINNLKLDKRFRVLNQKNSGLSGALNTGISNSKGQFLAFIDSDDLWFPNKLSCIKSILSLNPSANFISSNASWFKYNDGVKNEGVINYNILDLDIDPVIQVNIYNKFVTSSVVIKSELIEKIGFFDTNLKGTGDWDYWIRASRFGNFICSPEVLVSYRENEQGISKNKKYFHKMEWRVIVKNWRTVLLTHGLRPARLMLWAYYRKSMSIALENKNYFSFLLSLVICVSLSPWNINYKSSIIRFLNRKFS